MEVIDYIEPEIQTSYSEDYKNNKSRFEELWANSMSSDEFWGDVHKHIEMLYARKAAFEKHSLQAISGNELEKRVHKHIVEWYAARDKK
jgi:hypothetical protein